MAINTLTSAWLAFCLGSFCIANSIGVAANHEVRNGWPFHFITRDAFVVMQDGSVAFASVFHFLDGSIVNEFRLHSFLYNFAIAAICIVGSTVMVEQYRRKHAAKCQLSLGAIFAIVSSTCLFLAAHRQWSIGVSQTFVYIYIAQLAGVALWTVYLSMVLTMLAAVKWTVWLVQSNSSDR